MRGAAVFDRSPVQKIRVTRNGVEIVAGKATIVAETVIVATGEPGTLFSALARHFAEAETYVALTPPLGRRRAAHGRHTRRDCRGSIAPAAPAVLDR